MKTLLLITALLTISITVEAQYIDLDKKKGFKDLKIGDDLSKWKSDLQELGATTGTKAYKYVGYCCTEILDYKVKEIRLFFDLEDKMVNMEIKFSMKDLDKDGYILTGEVMQVAKVFNSYFGNPTSQSIDYGEFIFHWGGNTIGMTLRIEGQLDSDEAIVIIRDIEKERKGRESKF